MLPGAPTTPLRKFLEDRLSGMVPELASLLETETGCREAAARRAAAEHLNQSVRLLRAAPDFAAVAAVLLDASVPFAAGAAVFRVTGGALRGERVRGVTEERAGWFAALELPAAAAAPFAPAFESGDPVVALGGTGEVAGAMLELSAHSPDERICAFPIMAGDKPAALFYAWGEVDMAAMELLAQAAGLVLAGRSAPRQSSPDLVAIAPAVQGASPDGAAVRTAPHWDDMPAPARQAHLRAQRFARVQVAEMRLHHAEAVAAGRARRDLYGALRGTIDTARAAYRRQFPAPEIGDYLHEELLHTLANDDAALLGPQYPGSLD